MKVMKAVKIGSRKNKVGAKKTGMTTRIRRADPYTESWYEIVKKVKRRAGNACEKMWKYGQTRSSPPSASGQEAAEIIC